MEFSRIIVIGDLNCRLGISPAEHINAGGRAMRDFLANSPFVRVPLNLVTYLPSKSCLDHVLTTCPEAISDYGVMSDPLYSDHLPLWVQIDTSQQSSGQSWFEYHADIINYRHVARYVESSLPSYDTSMDFHSQVDQFVTTVHRGYARSTRTIKRNSPVRIHMSNHLKKLLRLRRKASGLRRKQLSKDIKREVRRLKRKSWSHFCTSVENDHHGRKMWSMFKRSRGTAHLISNNMEDQTSDDHKASFFADYHIISPDIAPNLSESQNQKLQSLDNDSSFVLPNQLSFSMSDLIPLLQGLPSKQSRGTDAISNLFLREIARMNLNDQPMFPKCLQWIHQCFQTSLRTGQVSQFWKTATIRALPKSNGGWRPISLLSNMGKLLERIVFQYLKAFCIDNELIPDHQYAFKHGTGPALTDLLSYVRQFNFPCYAVFFDVRKAFDRVHVPSLILKLMDVGVDLSVVRWIYNYMTNRIGNVGSASFV